MIFVPTLACNCRCLHCFEELNGHSIEISKLEMIFEKMLELAERVQCRTLSLYWIGGEVLCLNPDVVQKILAVAARVFQGSGITLAHRLQSNLLLYDSVKWQDVLAGAFQGRVSSSLDFPNLYRQAPGLGADEYLKAWLGKKETAERDGLKISVISLPNPHTLRLGAERFYLFFQEEVRVRNLQINFPFPGRNTPLQLLDLPEFARFMADLYELWIATGRNLDLSPFMYLENRLLHQSAEQNCWSSFSCATNFLAMGPDGTVGQCDYFVSTVNTVKEFNFGSLIDEPMDKIFNSPQRRLFLDRPLRLMQNSPCGECRFWKLCHGGCPIRAFTFTGNLFSPDHYCPVYQAMFSAILERGAVHAQQVLRSHEGEIHDS